MDRAQHQTYYYIDTLLLVPLIYNDNTLSRSDSRTAFGNLGADYTKKLDNEGHNFRIGLNARLNNNANEQYYNRFYDVYTDLDEHRYMLSNTYNYGGSLDARYNRPYSKDGELSYGLRADHQQTDNTFDRYNDTIGVLVDTLRTYQLKAAESSATADVNWTHRWGGFTLSTGLGLGGDRVGYNYFSDMPFADDSTLYFLNVLPSIHLTYRTESMHNWKLNYSMRMSHPRYNQITSFRSYGENSYSSQRPEKRVHA